MNQARVHLRYYAMTCVQRYKNEKNPFGTTYKNQCKRNAEATGGSFPRRTHSKWLLKCEQSEIFPNYFVLSKRKENQLSNRCTPETFRTESGHWFWHLEIIYWGYFLCNNCLNCVGTYFWFVSISNNYILARACKHTTSFLVKRVIFHKSHPTTSGEG